MNPRYQTLESCVASGCNNTYQSLLVTLFAAQKGRIWFDSNDAWQSKNGHVQPGQCTQNCKIFLIKFFQDGSRDVLCYSIVYTNAAML
mmetsp:Transcript_14013/g.32330  ORF Transcript_14013/g.32330 Transcript_14013/m.32330 type:complete len:88 (+) Transcript_14013:943-1206(+)